MLQPANFIKSIFCGKKRSRVVDCKRNNWFIVADRFRLILATIGALRNPTYGALIIRYLRRYYFCSQRPEGGMKHCFICRKPIRFWQRRLITYDVSNIKAWIHRRCWVYPPLSSRVRTCVRGGTGSDSLRGFPSTSN